MVPVRSSGIVGRVTMAGRTSGVALPGSDGQGTTSGAGGVAAGRGVRADAGVGPSPWLDDDPGRLAGVEHLAVATRVVRASRSVGKRSVNPDAGTDAPPLGKVAGGSAHEKPAAAGPGGGRCSSVFLGGTPYPLTGHPRGKGAGAGGGDERPGLKR